jgi:hypothetical protein
MDTILKLQDSNVSVFQEERFTDSSVFHGFFGRQGGVSDGVYDSLNCGLGTDDAQAHVNENRRRVSEYVGVKPENLLSLYQVHGKDCLTVDVPWALDKNRPKADAFVTDKPGLGLGVLTADCVPVLFTGKKQDNAPVIGAAHAGWKGALGGVLNSTVTAMMTLGAVKETIRVCIGPCIAKASYEVDKDFALPFLKENDESERFFHVAKKDGHLMFDLAGYCAWRLFREGVKNVLILDRDTYTQENDFFSYRRAIHRKEQDYARQISVIAIQSRDETCAKP